MILIDSSKKGKHYIHYIAAADGEDLSAAVIKQRYALCDDEANILKSPVECYGIYSPALIIYMNVLLSGNGPFKVHTQSFDRDGQLCVAIRIETSADKYLVFTPVTDKLTQVLADTRKQIESYADTLMTEFSPSSMIDPKGFLPMGGLFTDNTGNSIWFN